VRTGKIIGDQVEIVSGLNAGQPYVVDVPPKLKDGIKIKAQALQ
jgi:multidrug efflux pump subunit AcrA (membrane-fusion protein)